MFEDKTFEDILSSMLEYVSDTNPDLDTREGSIIYTALAPIALELETAYHEMNMVLEETFLATASKEYLVKHGNQMGVELDEASYGHFKGEFDVDLDIGSRFNLDELNYTVVEKLSDPNDENPYYTFELVCETAGSEPNTCFGDLTPITYISPNLSYAKLVSVITYGEDEEETEVYRYKLQTHAKNPPVDGNIAQYEEWLAQYDGIGKYKIIPCWNGRNTVKLTILNPENERASDELIQEVQEYFDPPTETINDNIDAENYPQGRGMGNGQASIGAIVTVDSVTEIPVEVECTITLNDGYTAITGVKEAVDNYLKSITLSQSSVEYMSIWAEIYAVDCVNSIKSLVVTIGDVVMDKEITPFINSVALGDDEIPVLDEENSVWGA